jgi:hypothetical protein
MDRVGLLVLGTRVVGDAFSKSGSFSPRANAPAPASSKGEFLLSPSFHVIELLIYNNMK